MPESQLQVSDLAVSYGSSKVLQGTSLSIAAGEIHCLLGPSGCGKSTLLRAVAGLVPVTKGTITISGQAVEGPGLSVPTHRRRIGMVFQSNALFPHLTVANNIGFGLPRRDPHRADTVNRLLSLINLSGYGHRYPHQLSGGEQQRVAVARALAPKPGLLLLDECFSDLDATMRLTLAADVKKIIQAEKSTALFVTHDQDEAFTIADSISVMHDGRIEQQGSAVELYREPATMFVANFVGQNSVLTRDQLTMINGQFPEKLGSAPIIVRPEDFEIWPESFDPNAVIVNNSFHGSICRITALVGSLEILIETSSNRQFNSGQPVAVHVARWHQIDDTSIL